MKISIFVVFLMVTGFFVFGCEDDTVSSPTKTSDSEECLAGDTIRVTANEHFKISIYNEGANGQFYWFMADGLSDEIVEYLGYRTEETNPGVFGSSINQIWEYEAIDLGTTCAMLEYKRAFPEDAPVLETKNIVVIVE